MRRYHRWLSVLFGLLIIWIAATGLLSHGAALYRDAQPVAPLIPTAQAHEGAPMSPAAATSASAPATSASATAAGPATPAAFTCPATMTCRAKPAPDSASAWVSYFHHIHAGEEFGLIGTILSIASGFALLFFAFSGLWMYLQMYRRRSHRHSHPKRIFW